MVREEIEALVLGVPHPEWGAQVAAAVVGSVNPDAVRQHAQEHLGSHAAPKIVLTLDKLPLLPRVSDRSEVPAASVTS